MSFTTVKNNIAASLAKSSEPFPRDETARGRSLGIVIASEANLRAPAELEVIHNPIADVKGIGELESVAAKSRLSAATIDRRNIDLPLGVSLGDGAAGCFVEMDRSGGDVGNDTLVDHQ